MAGIQLGVVDSNFTNSRKAVADQGGDDTDLATPLNYTSIEAMRARLTAIDAGYYTATRLNELSANDMVYAVRSHDDGTSIANYTANYTP